MSNITVITPKGLDTVNVYGPRIMPYKDMTIYHGYSREEYSRWPKYHHRVLKKVKQWSDRVNVPVHKIIIPHNYHLSGSENTDHRLSDPNTLVMLMFHAGGNFNKSFGHPKGTGFCVVEDKFYRILSYRSLGIRLYRDAVQNIVLGSQDGMMLFLVECNLINSEPYHSSLVSEIGNICFKQKIRHAKI